MLALAAMVSGCATMPPPENRWGAQYQPTERIETAAEVRAHAADRCRVPDAPADLPSLRQVAAAPLASAPPQLSAGDRFMLQVAGDKDVLSGTYTVGADGTVAIAPGLVINAAGMDRDSFERALRRQLVAGGYVRDIAGNVRLLQVSVASVAVSVEGAVFQPGVTVVGERSNEEHATLIDHPAQGDFNGARTLTRALQLAGGLRPDAWPDTVYLIRGDTYAVFDVRPALVGGVGQANLPDNLQLAKGDRVFVASTGCFDAHLVRPSPVTAPGIRVYMSNLSRPATHNAGSAIGRDSTSLPYGTRFLQGLIAANCVGGSGLNAQRSAVLISRNPVNGRSVVISRSIEHLVRDDERDDIDPYLMPGDAIACYDSAAMNVVDVVGVIGSALTPAALFQNLRK